MLSSRTPVEASRPLLHLEGKAAASIGRLLPVAKVISFRSQQGRPTFVDTLAGFDTSLRWRRPIGVAQQITQPTSDCYQLDAKPAYINADVTHIAATRSGFRENRLYLPDPLG
ncbi:hypothetical protein GCM10011402_35760 [Paracoccus acridae]|uniref:Uncharacterized protein n=1 Tax=Paracoccus acridae TaxID=1795310 RepID=A0ABQ1VM08_9RHOB|nr:hypothetical protein GCM10011402_35760 [Paracoccus acridae]